MALQSTPLQSAEPAYGFTPSLTMPEFNLINTPLQRGVRPSADVGNRFEDFRRPLKGLETGPERAMFRNGCYTQQATRSTLNAPHLTLFLLFLTAVSCLSATFQEDFSTNPLAHNWRIFGNTNLFNWEAANQNLYVTWDSSSSNSYFQLPTGTILTRQDDFSFALDLRIDDIAGGINPSKPAPFELAFGFQNCIDAQKTNFFRGNGRNSPNVVEFDYFAGASGIQPTVWPSMWSTNSTLSYNGPGDYTVMTLPLGIFMHIAVAYTASNQTLAITITTNGIAVGSVHSAKVSTNFTDFRVGTFAVSSYTDAGQSGSGQGSILAHGAIDNITVSVPDPPIQSLQAIFTNAISQVQFVSRSNWVYTLERTIDLQSWSGASPPTPGNATNTVLEDTNPPAANACYRIRAERP